eukprot:926552_1
MSSRSDFRNRSRHPAYDGIRPSCVSFRRTKVLSRPPRGYDGPIMRIRSRGHDHSRIPMKPIRRRSRENRGPWNREKSSRPSDSLESLVFSVPLAIADSLITGDQGQTVRSVEARFGCTLEVSVPDFRTATCQLTVRGRKPGVCGRVRDFVRGIEVRNNSFDHKPVQPNESLTIQIDSSEVEVHPPRYGLHNIFSISPLSRSESVSRRVTRKPDTSQVRAARKPDTSQVSAARKPDTRPTRSESTISRDYPPAVGRDFIEDPLKSLGIASLPVYPMDMKSGRVESGHDTTSRGVRESSTKSNPSYRSRDNSKNTGKIKISK